MARRVAVQVGLALALVGPPAHARAPEPTAELEAARSARRGSRIVFHGWSRDSRLVAYTRERLGRGGEPEQRMHRFVEEGRFTGFGRKVGGDVASYARARGYVATPLPQRRTSETHLELRLGERTLSLDFDVGRAHGWRWSDERRVLAEHRFDRIYVGFEAEVFVAPDETQAVIAMHLDTGWEIDAAVFAVPLR